MTYLNNFWTSEFQLYCDVISNEQRVVKEIYEILAYIESEFSSFNDDSLVSKYNRGEINNSNILNWEYICGQDKSLQLYIHRFASYLQNDTFDFTGILKGLAIEKIGKMLIELGSKSYLINFGGDIVGYNTNANIRVNDNFNIIKKGNFSIFTSGNTEKRGDHIKLIGEPHNYSTVTIITDDCNSILADYYSTSLYSDPSGYLAKAIENNKSVKAIYITRDGKIDFGSQYIASPFFNDKEIMIRDKMVTHFNKYFRPDQTETSKKFDTDHSEELSKLVFQDNLNEIFTTTSMCFPMYTDDLGTLFEVGVCRRLGHPLFRYDYTKDLVTLLDFEDKELSIINCNKPTPIVDCSNLAGAVLVGYNYDHETLCYKIGKLNDNLMLSTTFKRVEKDSSGKYKIMPKKMAEIR